MLIINLQLKSGSWQPEPETHTGRDKRTGGQRWLQHHRLAGRRHGYRQDCNPGACRVKLHLVPVQTGRTGTSELNVRIVADFLKETQVSRGEN